MSCIDHGQKGTGKLGYGTLRIPGTGRKTSAHRVVYMKHNAVSPQDIDGKVIRHTCDNARCINPEHLVIGTYQDNMDDKVSRGRCPKPGAKVSADVVDFIRKHYKPKCREFGATPLAARFGLTMNSVWRIAKGVTFQ